MKRSTKRKALPLVFALVLTVVGAALAVPTFTVNVQSIGEGGPKAILVPGNVTLATVNWDVSTTNPDYVTGVIVKFDKDLPSGTTIYVKVYGSGGGIIAIGDTSLNADLTAGDTVSIAFNGTVEIKNMTEVAVVLVGPEQ